MREPSTFYMLTIQPKQKNKATTHNSFVQDFFVSFQAQHVSVGEEEEVDPPP